MTEEGSGGRIARNTLANGAGTFTGVLVALLITPFLVSQLGTSAFGIWALAQSFSFLGGYASLTDLGVEGAVARYVAEARSEGDEERVNRTASSALAFAIAVALIVVPILVAVSYPLTGAFGIEEAARGPATLCFALVGVQLLFELPARVFFALIEGAQRFTIYQGIELARAGVQAVLIVGGLLLNLGLPGLGGAVAATSLVVLGLGFVAARRVVPSLHLRWADVSRETVRTLLGFGTSLFAIRLVGVLYRQLDRIIVGVALGTAAVAVYEIAQRIHAGAAMVQSVASSALLPATAYSRADRERLREMFLRGSAYTVGVAMPITVGAFVLAEDLIRTWVGDSLLAATEPTRLFLLYLPFAATHIVGSTMVVALGKIRFILITSIVNLAISVGGSIALVGPLGVEGVIIGTLAGQILTWIPLLWFFLRHFEVGLGEWAGRVLWPSVPAVAAQAITALPLLWVADRSSNLAEVGLLFLASAAIGTAVFARTGLSSDQRDALARTMRSALGRPARS